MGAVRKRLHKGQAVWFVDYVAANGQRVRQTVGPGDENKLLAKKVLDSIEQREAAS